MTNKYIINGYDLWEAYKIHVKSADGLDITPKVKKRDEYNWPEESGIDVDSSTRLTYEALDISLQCVVLESTYKECIGRINGLINLLSDDGFHLLGSVLRGRLYPVMLQEVSSYKRVNAANSAVVAVEFTVKLISPLPECRMGSATVLAAGVVSLDSETDKLTTVWWGDGASSTGTGVLSHTYTNAGTYTILAAGTGVTSTIFTVTGGIVIDEYSYPATGDIIHVDVSHTSEAVWQMYQDILATVEWLRSIRGVGVFVQSSEPTEALENDIWIKI